jgi:predicted HTH domain antitoxin
LLTPQKGLAELEKETRLALALKYYESGAISTGLAAQLIGISREAFWYLMGDYGLSLFELTEDLLAELENASTANYQ